MNPAVRKTALAVTVALTLLGFWLLLRQLGLPGDFSAEAIAGWLSGSGSFGPLLLMLVMTLAVVVGPIPTLPISAASGLAFGLAAGTLIASFGALVGALISFGIARYLARDLVRRRLGSNPVFHERAPQRALFWGIFLTRLIPLFSFALVSYAAGLTGVRTRRFAVATWLGMLPMTLVFAGLGDRFRVHPVTTAVAGSLLLLIMITAPWYLNRYHGDRLRGWFRPAKGDDDP